MNKIIKALSIAGKTQGKISRQVGCSQCAVSKCLQGKSPGRKKCGTWMCCHQAERPKVGETGVLEQISEVRGNCPAVECWWCACFTINKLTTYCRIKEMGYANRIPRVKPLLNFKQCKKRLTWATENEYWTIGQWSRVIFSDKSKFCISFGNRWLQVWRKPYKADKPGCTKASIKFA